MADFFGQIFKGIFKVTSVARGKPGPLVCFLHCVHKRGPRRFHISLFTTQNFPILAVKFSRTFFSGDASKTGMDREQLVRVLEDLTNATENVVSKDRGVAGGRGGVQVIGLMAMAGWGTENQEARQQFAEVRQIRDSVASSDHPLPELSMGMSGDFAEAIAEGSTMVRIGSRLFEGVMEPR